MFFVHIFCLICWSLIPQINGQVDSDDHVQSPPNFPSTILLTIIDYENWATELKVKNLWTAIPSTAQDVVTLANWAKSNSYRLRTSGSMHNWSPLTVTKTSNENVVLVDTTKNLISMEMTSSPNVSIKAVTVQTGTTMLRLLNFLEKKGLGLYVAPAPGDITVGGVIAIGAHGTGIPAVGEKIPVGHAYGTISNLIISFTAVVWDSETKVYVLKTFQRSDTDAKAILIHLGRTFITDVTLMVGPNYNLRCQSYTDISGEELFADPAKVTNSTRTFASFLDKNGRIETISFPYTNSMTWLKVWSITPQKPYSSRKVSDPYNYLFSDTIPENIAKLYASVSNGLTLLNPTFFNAQFTAIQLGLLATLSFDIWGPSKNLLLYVKPSTLRMTSNGYAIITMRNNIQKVVSTVVSYYNSLLEFYSATQKFPLGQFEIRTTMLDEPNVIPNSESPTFSAIHPIENSSQFNVAVWFDILSVPNADYANEALAKFESFLYSTFDGKDAVVRCEWSKGWAYTDEAAWSNTTVYEDLIPSTFPTSTSKNGWKWAVSTLDKYDPERIFTNDFIDKLLKL